MAEQFYTILTNIGKAKIANALSTGTKVNLTKLKIGDSNGTYYNPSESQTDLVHKVYECNVTSVEVDKDNPSWITITAVIPSDIGGFSIREVGVFDDANSLIAIGKYPETYKPVASDGSTKELYIKMTLEVTNASSVDLKIDPTVIIATKKDINNLQEQITENTTQLNANANNIKNYGHFGISANLSVASSTSTIGLALDTSIVSNIDLYTLENNQITIKQDGVYIIEFGVEFEKNSTGLRDIRIYGNSIPIGATSVMAVDALSTKLNVRAIANLSAGQKVYGSVIQNSGSALNIASGNFTYFKIRKLA